MSVCVKEIGFIHETVLKQTSINIMFVDNVIRTLRLIIKLINEVLFFFQLLMDHKIKASVMNKINLLIYIN